MSNHKSLTLIAGLLLAMLLLGLVVNGLFELVLIKTQASLTGYQLDVFIKQWLAATLLVAGVLLVSLAPAVTVIYPRLRTLAIMTLLLWLSSIMVRYSLSWFIQWAGLYYWQMMENGLVIYYLNACYLLAVLLFIVITQLALSAVCSGEHGRVLTHSVGMLLAFSGWLAGLTLYHTNELIAPLAFSLAMDLHLSAQSALRWVYLFCLLAYLASQLVVVIWYRKKILAQARCLLTIGVIVWLVPLLMVDTLRVLLVKLMPYVGSAMCLALYYLLQLVVTCLVFYLFYNKHTPSYSSNHNS